MNLEKWYKVGRKFSYDLGNDLIHHTFERNNFFIDKSDAYIYTVIRNEFYNKKSSFNKIYNPKEGIDFDIEENKGYDVNLIYTILLQLENEGYTLEVKVFKECYFNTNKTKFAKKTKVDYVTVKKICDFIINEIKNRYVIHDVD